MKRKAPWQLFEAQIVAPHALADDLLKGDGGLRSSKEEKSPGDLLPKRPRITVARLAEKSEQPVEYNTVLNMLQALGKVPDLLIALSMLFLPHCQIRNLLSDFVSRHFLPNVRSRGNQQTGDGHESIRRADQSAGLPPMAHKIALICSLGSNHAPKRRTAERNATAMGNRKSGCN